MPDRPVLVLSVELMPVAVGVVGVNDAVVHVFELEVPLTFLLAHRIRHGTREQAALDRSRDIDSQAGRVGPTRRPVPTVEVELITGQIRREPVTTRFEIEKYAVVRLRPLLIFARGFVPDPRVILAVLGRVRPAQA